jgi:hypothetical protein
MTINEAVVAIDEFLRTYDGGSGRPVELQVRPSGDDVDVIKIWIDLGAARRGLDRDAYERACAAAIREALPATQAFRLMILAETDPA